MTDPSTPPRQTFATSSAISPSISMETIAVASSTLSDLMRASLQTLNSGRLPVDHNDPNRGVRDRLPHVWLTVNDLLSQDKKLEPSLLNREEFRAKVRERGEDTFIDMLKKLASEDGASASGLSTQESPSKLSTKSEQTKVYPWMSLFEDDVFYAPPEPTTNISQAGLHATLHAWGLEFKGNAANALLHSISDFLNLEKSPYSRSTSIINSSGTGKSRMVDELSVGMGVIIVPMCLHPAGSQGFPPPDVHLRDFLVTKVERLKSHAELSMHGIIYALLSETFEALTIIDSSVKVKVNNPAIEPELYVQSVID